VRFTATVEIVGLEGMADPEGQTIERALPALGFAGVEGVHVGKVIRFLIEAPDAKAAAETVGAMCERFLTNPVIETASIRLEAGPAGISMPLESGSAADAVPAVDQP